MFYLLIQHSFCHYSLPSSRLRPVNFLSIFWYCLMLSRPYFSSPLSFHYSLQAKFPYCDSARNSPWPATFISSIHALIAGENNFSLKINSWIARKRKRKRKTFDLFFFIFVDCDLCLYVFRGFGMKRSVLGCFESEVNRRHKVSRLVPFSFSRHFVHLRTSVLLLSVVCGIRFTAFFLYFKFSLTSRAV